MSSNYLNYELSAELKRLGVEWHYVEAVWALHDGSNDWHLLTKAGIEFGYVGDTITDINFSYAYGDGFDHDDNEEAYRNPDFPEHVIAPSTAQLIDEIWRIGGMEMEKYAEDGDYIITAYPIDERFIDPCCTMALGKALIELVKSNKNNKTVGFESEKSTEGEEDE